MPVSRYILLLLAVMALAGLTVLLGAVFAPHAAPFAAVVAVTMVLALGARWWIRKR